MEALDDRFIRNGLQAQAEITGHLQEVRKPGHFADWLAKDRDPLLTFYDFPAEHWLHIRTTNPIESTFATVRPRTTKTRGCVARAGL